jgi:type IV pilus biogenesis protein PilP
MRVKSLLLMALCLPQLALSAEPPQPTIGDLSRVQSATIMFEANAKMAKAKGDMLENQAKAGDDLTDPHATGGAAVKEEKLPTVVGISGAQGRLFATFLYPDGTTVRSKSGEKVPGGYLVSEVGIDRVVLTVGDRRIPLKFGVASLPPAPVGGVQPFPGMMQPPMPMR